MIVVYLSKMDWGYCRASVSRINQFLVLTWASLFYSGSKGV